MDVRLVNEIKTMGRFLESRQKMGYVGDLAERLAEAMTRSVADLPCLDAEAAARLTDAVEQSAYLRAGKDTITKAIDAKLVQYGPIGSAPAKGGRPKKQAQGESSGAGGSSATQYLWQGIGNYFTAAEWDVLKSDRKSKDCKIQAIVDRMQRIGI